MTALLVNVMREVRRVPDRYVLVIGALSIDEAADISRSIRLGLSCLTWGSGYSVIDLPIVMPQDPHVTASEGVCDTVVWVRDQHVSITSCGVLDPPSSTGEGFRRRMTSQRLMCQFEEVMGGELNSQTTLFPSARMSKSNLQ